MLKLLLIRFTAAATSPVPIVGAAGTLSTTEVCVLLLQSFISDKMTKSSLNSATGIVSTLLVMGPLFKSRESEPEIPLSLVLCKGDNRSAKSFKDKSYFLL